MKNKETLEKTIEKNKDFILPMDWDVMFCNVFKAEEALPLLEYIISVLNDMDIEEVKGKLDVETSEFRVNFTGDVTNRSFVTANYNLGKRNACKYIFEIGSASTTKLRREANARKALDTLEKGIIPYCGNYLKTYNVVLIDFNPITLPDEDLVGIAALRDEEGDIVDDSLKMIEVNMSKAQNSDYKCANKKEEQTSIISKILTTRSLTELNTELNKIMNKEETEKLINLVKKFSNNDKYKVVFDEEEYCKELICNINLAKICEESTKQSIITIAKNLIKLNLTNEQISCSTRLTIAEIENLRKN